MNDYAAYKVISDRVVELELQLAVVHAALEALASDARRYQWLKANARRIDFMGVSWSQGCELDARIDAAEAGGDLRSIAGECAYCRKPLPFNRAGVFCSQECADNVKPARDGPECTPCVD